MHDLIVIRYRIFRLFIHGYGATDQQRAIVAVTPSVQPRLQIVRGPKDQRLAKKLPGDKYFFHDIVSIRAKKYQTTCR